MNKKVLLVATLTLSLSIFGCKSKEAPVVEKSSTEHVENIVEETPDGGSVETEIKQEVTTTTKTTTKKPTKEEKKAADIKKAEDKINARSPKVPKEVEIKVDPETLKKEVEAKKAEEELLKGGRTRTNKGM